MGYLDRRSERSEPFNFPIQPVTNLILFQHAARYALIRGYNKEEAVKFARVVKAISMMEAGYD